MKTLNFFIFSLLTMISSAWAGGGIDISGGGGGIREGNKVYLTDLYENGIHQNPYINQAQALNEELYGSLAYNHVGLAHLSEQTLQALIFKIQDIQQYDPILAAALFEAIQITNWSFTNQTLEKTSDTKPCLVSSSVVQLAIRQGSTVLVSKPLFEEMDAKNQAALIIHEVVSALSKTEESTVCQIRRAVAFLFSKNAPWFSREYKKTVLAGLPTKYEKSIAQQAFASREVAFYTQWAPQGASLTDSNLQLTKQSQYLFFPQLQIQNSTATEIQDYQTSTWDFRNIRQICDLTSSITNIEFKAWTFSVYPKSLTAGKLEPKLNWQFKQKLVWQLSIPKNVNLPSQEICTAIDFKSFHILEQWPETFIPIQSHWGN